MHTRLPPCSLHCCIGRSSCTMRMHMHMHMHICTRDVVETFGSKRCGGQTDYEGVSFSWVDSTGFVWDS